MTASPPRLIPLVGSPSRLWSPEPCAGRHAIVLAGRRIAEFNNKRRAVVAEDITKTHKCCETGPDGSAWAHIRSQSIPLALARFWDASWLPKSIKITESLFPGIGGQGEGHLRCQVARRRRRHPWGLHPQVPCHGELAKRQPWGIQSSLCNLTFVPPAKCKERMKSFLYNVAADSINLLKERFLC